MRTNPFNILPAELLEAYKAATSEEELHAAFNQLEDAELSTPEFSFYTSVASVYSSKIEGEPIELDSYIKHKRFNIPFEPDYTRKTDDLYLAYQYAKEHTPDTATIPQTHEILAKHIVAKNGLGKLRNGNMYVTTKDGRIEYVATTPNKVPIEMDKFYTDLERLLQEQLTIQEAFFFASLIHLVFVKIHPWNDLNGRNARLIEKWFLAQHLGPKAWFLESEKLYYIRHTAYYHNIRKIGIEYPELDYAQAMPFLLMLSQSLNTANEE